MNSRTSRPLLGSAVANSRKHSVFKHQADAVFIFKMNFLSEATKPKKNKQANKKINR